MKKSFVFVLVVLILSSCGPSKQEMEQIARQQAEMRQQEKSQYVKLLEENDYHRIEILTVEGKSFIVIIAHSGITMHPL